MDCSKLSRLWVWMLWIVPPVCCLIIIVLIIRGTNIKQQEGTRADNNGGGDGDGSIILPEDSEYPVVTITYSLWLGDNVTKSYMLNMEVPLKSSFYHVMEMAAKQDPRFEFEAIETPQNHYVQFLAYQKEYIINDHFWILYCLPKVPDPANPPGDQFQSSLGVDLELANDGQHYLLWYKKW